MESRILWGIGRLVFKNPRQSYNLLINMFPTPEKIRRSRIWSIITAAFICAIGCATAFLTVPAEGFRVILLLVTAIITAETYRLGTGRWRRREKLASSPFPPEWEQILKDRVAFYNGIGEVEKARFRTMVRIFIAETRISGIDVEVDDTCRLLTAASSVIPVFGFPAWEYSMLREVLIYPNRFDGDNGPDASDQASTLGMVGNTGGAFNGLMVLSKPDLYHGFEIHGDKHNVGVHEFAHLVDKGSGAIDGIPAGMPEECVGPWTQLVGRELQHRGDSDIPAYGYTNREEFLAVTTEYFFESPDKLSEHHPELYDLLRKSFQQNPRRTFTDLVKRIFRPGRRRTGRNAPCPCGSGKKFKRCCLKKARKRG